MCRGTNGAIVKDPASSKDARFALELLCITMANLLCVAIHMSRTTVYLLPFIKNKKKIINNTLALPQPYQL